MARFVRAADAAKNLLSTASHRLLTSDPTRLPDVRHALDQSLDWSLRDRSPSAQLGRPFEPAFSETSANSLAFMVQPGDPAASPVDRSELSTAVMRDLLGHHFGVGALRWFDGKSEAQRARHARRDGSRGFGASFAAGIDRSGLSEAAVTYEWDGGDLQQFSESVVQLALRATAALPGLVPFLTTIRCGRRSGGQQISFAIDRELDLNALQPLMNELGLGARHGGLLTLTGFILGARFVLPANSSTLTLLNTPQGVEMRLDINLDALPDTPQQLLPLLRLPMTERPQSLAALDRWMTALTPDGYYGPGAISVLSIRVREDLPARVALYLRPVTFQPASSEPAPAAPAGLSLNRAGAMPDNEFAAESMPA